MPQTKDLEFLGLHAIEDRFHAFRLTYVYNIFPCRQLREIMVEALLEQPDFAGEPQH